MPQQCLYKVHDNGPALWPEHKPLAEVLQLQAATPEPVWQATYQLNPTPPAGYVFKQSWWAGKNRYDQSEAIWSQATVARWISWDTAMKDKDENAYSACVIGNLFKDYRLLVWEVWRERLEFPDLPAEIERFARLYNKDGRLRGVLIEDKASGTSAYQTLKATAEPWLVPLLQAFMPQGDKVQRSQQAAVHCKNGSVLLPQPGPLWLYDFEDELFTFPGSAFKDQVDAFSQLILWTENLLAEGYRLRAGIKGNVD